MAKKKAAAAPKQERTKQKVLENFLKMLTALYPKDKLAPGVVISYLPEGQWYGAIYQYPNLKDVGITDRRVLLHSAKADTINQLIMELIAPWSTALDCIKL